MNDEHWRDTKSVTPSVSRLACVCFDLAVVGRRHKTNDTETTMMDAVNGGSIISPFCFLSGPLHTWNSQKAIERLFP
jgi:hypothetical protein